MSKIHPTMQRVFDAIGNGSSDIARAINTSPQNINNWSKRGISKKGAIDIAKKYDLSVDWVLTGKGEMNSKPSFDELKSMVKDLESKEIDRIEVNDYIPVISWVAAGGFVEVVDSVTLGDVEEWIPRPPNAPKNSFGLRVRGRSMYPEFKPGEIIYINPNISPIDLNDGDLIVIQYAEGGEATFKQLIVGETSKDMYLKPLNSEWHEQTITPLEECKLVGKVYAKYVTY